MERKKSESFVGEAEAVAASAQIKDWAKTGANRAGDAVSRGTQAAAAASSEAASSAGSAVDGMRAEIRNIQDMLGRLAAHYGQDAVSSARSAANAAAERLGDMANRGANAASVASERAKSLAGELEAMARRNPMGVIAGAIVVGVLIGVFSRRSD